MKPQDDFKKLYDWAFVNTNDIHVQHREGLVVKFIDSGYESCVDGFY